MGNKIWTYASLCLLKYTRNCLWNLSGVIIGHKLLCIKCSVALNSSEFHLSLIQRVSILRCLQIAVWGFLEHIWVLFGLKLSKYTDFSKFETCNHRKQSLNFSVGIIYNEMCIYSNITSIAFFRREALWHSSQFRSVYSHSARSSAQCTWFVITC